MVSVNVIKEEEHGARAIREAARTLDTKNAAIPCLAYTSRPDGETAASEPRDQVHQSNFTA